MQIKRKDSGKARAEICGICTSSTNNVTQATHAAKCLQVRSMKVSQRRLNTIREQSSPTQGSLEGQNKQDFAINAIGGLQKKKHTYATSIARQGIPNTDRVLGTAIDLKRPSGRQDAMADQNGKGGSSPCQAARKILFIQVGR